jgi:hypothetical protein
MLEKAPVLLLKFDNSVSAHNYNYKWGHYSSGLSSSNHNIKNFFTLMENGMSLGLATEVAKLVKDNIVQVFANTNAQTDLDYILQILEAFSTFAKKYQATRCPSPEVLKSMFVHMLQPHIDSVINRKPRETHDWTRKAQTCYARKGESRCTDCAELNRFLVNPDEQVARFTMVGGRRDHISRKLEGKFYIIETEKRRSPYTLVITKTKNGYEDMVSQWKRDISGMHSKLAPFRTSWLENVLGDRYDELILLSELVRSSVAQSTPSTTARLVAYQPARPAAGPTPRPTFGAATVLNARTAQSLNTRAAPPVARVKRKAEAQLSGPTAVKKKKA